MGRTHYFPRYRYQAYEKIPLLFLIHNYYTRNCHTQEYGIKTMFILPVNSMVEYWPFLLVRGIYAIYIRLYIGVLL